MANRVHMTANKNVRMVVSNENPDVPAAFIVKTDRGYKVMKLNKKSTELYPSYREAADSALTAVPVAV